MSESCLPIAATFSKDPKFFGKDFEPAVLHGGCGAMVMGDGYKWYLDWVSALGANLLGYPDPRRKDEYPANIVAGRAGKQCDLGVGFTLPHYLERQVGEKIVHLLGAHVPGWQNQPLGVRFGLSGSDACSMAVRLARAVTGRPGILSVGYHGWHDSFVSTTSPHWGVTMPQFCYALPFGDLSILPEELADGDPIAAVIIEQTAQNPPIGYWQDVRRLCTEHGALLIVDEVVTWPRFALGGACEVYGIEPDLICLGKGLGNGIPISAIIGRREYFEWFSRNDPVFVSSTHFGNAVSLAAADAVLDVWDQAGVDHLWAIGTALMDGLRLAYYTVIGQPPRSLLQFASNAERGYFIIGMRDRAVLINRPNLPNLAHTLADVAKTIKAAAEVKAEMERVDVQEVMRGKEPCVLFEGR